MECEGYWVMNSLLWNKVVKLEREGKQEWPSVYKGDMAEGVVNPLNIIEVNVPQSGQGSVKHSSRNLVT